MPPPGVGANLSSPAAAVAISGVNMDEKVDSVVGESSGRVMKSAAERIPEPHARRPRASPAAPTAEQACPSMKSLHLEEAVISGGELLHKEVEPETDVDKQRLRWEAVDEERQVWDAMDEQHKFKKKEEKMQKKEERRQKQDKKRKRKLDVEVTIKELEDRRKKSAKIQESKMVRAEGGGSSLAKKLSQRPTRSPLARLPLVSSPGVNMLKSGLGVLASAAASKRRRSLSERDESSPSQKKSKSAVRSPSPRTSILRGSKRIHSHGRKIRRLTSAVWRDFNPRYDDGKLVEAECKHCNEVFPAGRDVGTSGAQRHLATCKIRCCSTLG